MEINLLEFLTFGEEFIEVIIQNGRQLAAISLPVLLLALFAISPARIVAQSPNTASMIVVVVDQAGAVVKDAKVLVVNDATGAAREALSGSEGSATFSALSLTGTYTVTVSKDGFGDEQLKDIALLSSETATVKVKLLVGSEKAEVTVFGTSDGVRPNPMIGLPLKSQRIDETPILGRKRASAATSKLRVRTGKGLGDLFVNATYLSPALAHVNVHARRREQR